MCVYCMLVCLYIKGEMTPVEKQLLGGGFHALYR